MSILFNDPSLADIQAWLEQEKVQFPCTVVLHTNEGRFWLHNVSEIWPSRNKLQLCDAQGAILAEVKAGPRYYFDYLGDYLPDIYNARNALEIRI